MTTSGLQELLAYHRSLIDPTEYGFEAKSGGRGRPVEGLRQGQMDQLLVRWPAGMYGRLERGKIACPPTEFLDDVARILRLSEQKRKKVWQLALDGAVPPHPLDPDAAPDVSLGWQRVLDGFSHMACITDLAGNVLAHNEAFPRMFPGQAPTNILEWAVLTDVVRRDWLPHWKECWGPLELAQLRARLRQYPTSTHLLDLAARVKADPFTRAIYTDPALDLVEPEGDDCRPLRHAQLGEGMVTVCSSNLPDDHLILVNLPFQPGPMHVPENSWTGSGSGADNDLYAGWSPTGW
ncbi:XRE family transcriptional regulator [Kitasatospora sp. GP82]|uniref:MmyB family transcriptional regulator n=1 Tax=Kitasatospora sp. GP82 TaxID=3035089 RepID=UPI002474BA5D|nr:XRE family transcriptional regulator [Kitasatospora sp. GP82]MDH6129417.1 hypothetical protein [Kitasatospora sp. GP82]